MDLKTKKIYHRINNSRRTELINKVINEGIQLKDAATILRINYSTAKTIIRVYRKENRVGRKYKCNEKVFKIDREKNSEISTIENDLKEPISKKSIFPSFTSSFYNLNELFMNSKLIYEKVLSDNLAAMKQEIDRGNKDIMSLVSLYSFFILNILFNEIDLVNHHFHLNNMIINCFLNRISKIYLLTVDQMYII